MASNSKNSNGGVQDGLKSWKEFDFQYSFDWWSVGYVSGLFVVIVVVWATVNFVLKKIWK